MYKDMLNDTTAVEKIIDNGLAMYPDYFDKAEAKRRLIEVYKKAITDIHKAQQDIIAELALEASEKEMKKENRRRINLFKKLS